MKPYLRTGILDAGPQSLVSSISERAFTAFDQPWLLRNELRRLLALPFLRAGLAWHGIAWGRSWRILGMPVIQRHRGSRIVLGDGLVLRSWRRSNPLLPHHPVVFATRSAGAEIRIGADCGLTGTTLVAAERIAIGNRVLIGANTSIVDTDFHPISPQQRREAPSVGRSRPVVIHDDVFVGMNCLILKGVTIGAGSVVGAGSVISHDVPPRAIVAGNPARVVRMLDP
jgi:acetyltransferase-like isoleucine patch superfamily enzyme